MTMEESVNQSDPLDRGPDLRDVLDVIRAYKWLIALITVVVAALAVAITLWLPKRYEATCTVEFDPSTPQPLGDDMDNLAMPVGSFLLTREFFETQNRILASRAVSQRVVERLELHRSPGFLRVSDEERASFSPVAPERAAQVLQQRVEVEPIKGTRIVRVNVQDHDPARAATLANALAEAYIEKTMEDRLGSTVNALDWLATQLDTLRGELESTELSLHDFKKEHGILSVSMEDRQEQLAHDIRQLSEALSKAQTRRIELAARVERLTRPKREDPSDGTVALPDDPAVAGLRSTLRMKRTELSRLSTEYGPAHPMRKAVQAEIATIETELDAAVAERVAAARGDLEEVQVAERQLAAALDELNRTGLELNLQEIEYRKLNREWENNSKLYQLLLQRTTETDMARMFRSNHVRIIDRALEPVTPVSPNLPLNSAAGVGAGLALALGVAFVRRRLDQRIQRPEDVEEMGLPLLGVVPLVASAKDASRNGKPPPQTDPIVVRSDPRSSAAECFRTVRTNLTFMSVGDPLRAMVVTSAVPEEGKTTIAANLAAAIAQSGKRVLLVDTDLRRPRVHKVFGVSNVDGVTSALVGNLAFHDAIQPSGIPGLDVLPCGPIPPNPSELLHGAGFTALLDFARKQFDTVIFDSPPLNAVTDAAVIAPQVDGVVFVVHAGSTHRDALRFGIRQLRHVKARTLGAVLNSVGTEGSRYGYGGYYYGRSEGYHSAGEAMAPGDVRA